METKQYTTHDRAGWGSGPWDGEPDKVQFVDEATGLPCLAVRSRHGGNWCGYVGVAEGHPLFGKNYDDLYPDFDIDVHGGLTFSDVCSPGGTEETGICHVPGPGEPEHVFWFGFDCAHAWDVCPAAEARDRYLDLAGSTYRTLEYVKRECASLARQLAAVKAARPTS